MKPSLNNQHKDHASLSTGVGWNMVLMRIYVDWVIGAVASLKEESMISSLFSFWSTVSHVRCCLHFISSPQKYLSWVMKIILKSILGKKKKKNILCKLLITKPTTTGINKSSTVSEYASINHSSSCTGTKITEAQGKHPQWAIGSFKHKSHMNSLHT